MPKALAVALDVSIPPNVETVLVSYTASGGEKWGGFSGAVGTWSARYRSFLNGQVKDGYLTSPEDRTGFSVIGEVLNQGDVVEVKALHTSDQGNQLFSATIMTE